MRYLLLPACLALAACSAQAPSEPAASAPAPAASSAAPAEEHTELRDAMQAPIDKAKAVDAEQRKDAEEQKKDIDDAGG